jgi:uncharacterized protein (DUF983 family)
MSGATAPQPWRTPRTDRDSPLNPSRSRAAVGPPFSLSEETLMSNIHARPTLSQTILRGIACKCPRCGKGKLFSGFLTLRPACEACEQDYSFIDAGDGPAVFIILIAGFIVVAAALIVEVKYQPPLWLHAALWIPLVIAVTSRRETFPISI